MYAFRQMILKYATFKKVKQMLIKNSFHNLRNIIFCFVTVVKFKITYITKHKSKLGYGRFMLK